MKTTKKNLELACSVGRLIAGMEAFDKFNDVCAGLSSELPSEGRDDMVESLWLENLRLMVPDMKVIVKWLEDNPEA